MKSSEFRVVYENGVFRPLERVSLPEHKVLVLVEKSVPEDPQFDEDDQSEILAVLGERFASGETDVAARHNEHQP